MAYGTSICVFAYFYARIKLICLQAWTYVYAGFAYVAINKAASQRLDLCRTFMSRTSA
jgi:hypothetical protein